MKTSPPLLAIVFAASSALAQGPLNPPSGAPAPSMRTLEQIEPRVPVSPVTTPGTSTTTYKIVQSGSYYLTGPLVGESGKNGIEIAADGVTLDLMGFELRGVSNSVSGIAIVPSRTNIEIRNGSLRFWGLHGVDGGGAVNARFLHLLLAANLGHGIKGGSTSTIADCRSTLNGAGISGQHRFLVSRCAADRNTAEGIIIGDDSVISDSTASQNGWHGIHTGSGASIVACTVSENHGIGIKFDDGTVAKCSARDNAGGGIHGSDSVITDSHVTGDGTGVGIKIVGGIVSRSVVVGVSGNGIEAGYGSEISGCSVKFCVGQGIVVESGCSVLNNNSTQNHFEAVTPIGGGITVTGSGNRIDGNHVQGNDHGLRILGANNIIMRNTARANTAGNFTIAAGNEAAQIITNPGTGFANTNPWANYAF